MSRVSCAYGTHGEARYIAHDTRGCLPVCTYHAHWRRTGTSRVGGHAKRDCTREDRVHITRIHDGAVMDEAFTLLNWSPQLRGEKRCSNEMQVTYG